MNISYTFNLTPPFNSGSLYIGATKDLEKRYAEHRIGSAGRTTSLDPPVSLVYSEEHESFSKARQREAQVKRWSRANKEADRQPPL